VGILFIDLDRFKDVNDTMGHHAGDDLLGQVTSRLCSALRATATLARIGGDEFVVLVPEIYGVADAIALATRIRACLTEPFAIEDRPVVMTCSVGVAVGHGHEADFESLLQRADGAMYDAKGLGRDTFVVDSPALTETWRRSVAMSSDLHHAIDRNELTISYPTPDPARHRRIVGVEALVRWQHPALGTIGPDVFVVIDRWVRRTAFAQVRSWLDAGLEPVRIAVNLSTRDLRDPNLPEKLTAQIEESG